MRYPTRVIVEINRPGLKRQLERAGVSAEGIAIMAMKIEPVVVRIDEVGAPAANILKQQMLSLGGDAAVHREVIRGGPERSTVHLIADRAKLSGLPVKLKGQPFGLEDLGREIGTLVARAFNPPYSISTPSGSIDLSTGPVIMGILNVTPDSFSDGGAWMEPGRAVDRALQMAREGAGIIDVGGESTRPGARAPDAAEELGRVMPVIEKLAGETGLPISIDTRKHEVAAAAMKAGASMINDISGGTRDPLIVDVARETGAAIVVMHMQGTPETMQDSPSYEDPVSEIISWLDSRTGDIIARGVDRGKIIVDPGIGFGKRLQDNLEIVDHAGDFLSLGFPVMVGLSRKSFLGTITGREPGERVWGGLAAAASCLDGGIGILRVHDVKETSDFIEVWKAIKRRG